MVNKFIDTIPTSDLIKELGLRKECIAIEPLKPPADIFPWYMIQHTFDQYYRVAGDGKILVVLQQEGKE